ncbi:MAG: FHA domain-containing protein [Clostridia bacterium]|nr:FHA domain-containing protein [Clostridia bacterium]
MQYIARIYFDNNIYSIDLTKFDSATIGSGDSDIIKLAAYDLKPGQVSITRTSKGFKIKGKNLYMGDKSLFLSRVVAEGEKYVVKCEPEILICIHPKQKEEEVFISLADKERLNIGRGSSNDIVLKNSRTSSEHCRIYKTGETFRIKDLDSRNGTYINGQRIYDEELRPNDFINISVYSIRVGADCIYVSNVGNDIVLNVDAGTPSQPSHDFLTPDFEGEPGTMRFF